MITPTVGRVVWFYPAPNREAGDHIDPFVYHGDQPCAAIVTHVWHDRMVNLAVFDSNGTPHSRTSVPLVQPGDERPSSYYCEWMPYQKGQAAKTEELQRQMASGSSSG